MTAIDIKGGSGAAEDLFPAEMDTPEPGPGQILIRVRAAGVNRPDLLQRRGFYPPPPGAPKTMGLEVAGDVAALGEGVTQWALGDRVCALLGGGGYAQYAVVDARHALAVPEGLCYAEASALPETLFTVWTNVFELGGLKAGETLMVHGATSGIGVAAIQMAKAAGARVIATGRGADKAAMALELGADLSVDAKAEDFVGPVQTFGGADVVLDMVGGDYAQRNIDCLNFGGRLVFIAFQGGAKAELDLSKIMMKRLTVTGSTLRARPADEKARLTAAVAQTVWPWVASGQVKAIIDRKFPLAEAAAAHAWLEQGAHVGKVVLEA
jgi:putative PIG3 family NAD(P)H quinone oxidoreductase